MGRGAAQQGQGPQGPGYNNPNAGGVGGQLPQLGGAELPPEMMVQNYRRMGRAFGGAPPGLASGPGQAASAFAPGGNPMNPDVLPITASSGPASTQTSPVAPTQSGVTPPSPASGFTGANPVGQPGPAEAPGKPAHKGPGMQQMLADTLRFG
jgi:hypothetical protein